MGMVARRSPGEERVLLHDPVTLDPDQEIVRRSHLSRSELEEIVGVLDAMHRWREAERRMSEASRRYMRLGETDMRALRLLIAAQRQGAVVTPSAVATHLGVSTASTTKLLDRLEAGGHIVRTRHPSDRRSIAIEVTEHTRRAARDSVGRLHARRFDVVAALSPEQRTAITAFFDALVATADDVDHEGRRPAGDRPAADDGL